MKEPKISEIDIIIEEGLKKIVEDKINEKLSYLNIESIAEGIVNRKYIKELEKINITKVKNGITFDKLVNYVDQNANESFMRHDMDSFIFTALEKGISNVLENKFDIYWNESNFFKEDNIEVKDKILHNEKINKKFVSSFKDFFNKYFK